MTFNDNGSAPGKAAQVPSSHFSSTTRQQAPLHSATQPRPSDSGAWSSRVARRYSPPPLRSMVVALSAALCAAFSTPAAWAPAAEPEPPPAPTISDPTSTDKNNDKAGEINRPAEAAAPAVPPAPTAPAGTDPAAGSAPAATPNTGTPTEPDEPTPAPRRPPPDPRAPRGKLLDRNGIPMAIDRNAISARQRKLLLKYGLDVYSVCEEERDRCYPLGGAAYHLLGDIRMPLRWNHTRTSFLERELDGRLSGILPVSNPADASVFLVDDTAAIPAPPPPPSMDVQLSIDARLQLVAADLISSFMTHRRLEKGAIVVLDPATFEVLALVSYPFPDAVGKDLRKLPRSDNAFYDRARHVYYPPGSTFKLVTAMAALRSDPALEQQTYSCQKLEEKRVGCVLPSGEIIRDDELDVRPHGTEAMEVGLFNSCNAYFAQLALHGLSTRALIDTAAIFGIETARPNTEDEVLKSLPQTAFGQGEVLATPLEMAMVAATIANGGRLYPPSYLAEADPEFEAAEGVQVISEEQASMLGRAMRRVVQSGTAKEIRKKTAVAVAGKTGTAEVDRRASHGWFVGYAPYEVVPREDGTIPRQIAFAIMLENSGYGGRTAAPLAARVVNAAMKLGIIDTPPAPEPRHHK